jgi:hypothetical protein
MGSAAEVAAEAVAKACAWACCAEKLRTSTTAIKKALPAHRPAPVSIAREDRSDQSIHAIPKSGHSRPKYQIAFN